ncbi:MAG: MFS transporter [Chloroflexi bacterium]|nr:MFS transporter [Chloroflexota bacterium]
MERVEKQVVAYTSICHALDHVLELTYGIVLIGIARDFGAGLFVLGVLANIAGFAFGLAALPAGWMTDRIGERRLLMVFCLGTGIASVGVGLAPNIYVLGVALAVLGLALGIYHPVGSSFIARATRQRGVAFGYLGVGGNLGVALGPILAGSIASPLGWRAPYFIFAIPAIVLAALLYNFNRTEIPVASADTNAADTSPRHPSSIILPLVIIFIASAMNGLVYRGLVTFLPVYFSQRLSFSFLHWDSMVFAGSFTTIALMFGIVGQLLGGYLCERRRHETLALIVSAIAVPLLLLMGNSQGIILLAAAIVFAAAYFMSQPIFNSLIADYAPVSWRGRSYGLNFFFTFGIGSFSATFLGYIAERQDINLVFITMAGISVLTVAGTLILLMRAMAASRRVNGGRHVSGIAPGR